MQVGSNQSNLRELQASLDAYMDKNLEFAELRTRWITTLAKNPEMRSSAVRLLYQQPADRHLTEDRALSLKRVVETAFHDGPDDWTVVFDDDSSAEPFVAEIRKTTSTKQATPNTVARSSVENDRPKSVNGTSESRPVTPKASSSDTLVAGHVLKDRFVLEELLGRGGIGVVYKAHDRLREHANAGSAQIALKVLREEFRAKPELLHALQREALQAQGLSHPNIVRVHDFHQDGKTSFVTMELLEGELLRAVLLREYPALLPQKKAMRIVAGMCRGLAHAHAHGVVHADFKPGNVFLTAGDKPKILDFGLVRAAAPGDPMGGVPPEKSSSATRAITPAYASCNRLEGGAPALSDDVYSLSCVIYELLAGHHPYDKKSALVARELKLRPKRIDGLTDVQWRTLATGLQPSRRARTTQARNLEAVFTDQVPLQPMSEPVRKKRGRTGVAAFAVTAFLLGGGLAFAVAFLGMQPIPSKYVERVRQSELMQSLESILGIRTNESSVVAQTTPSKSPPIVKHSPVAVIADSEVAEIPLADRVVPDADDPLLAPVDTPEPAIESPVPIEHREDLSAISMVDTPSFQLDSAVYVIQENATALAMQINRRGDLSTRASVEWTTFAGSAEPQLDYASFERRVEQFAVGEKTKTILIPIVADVTAESIENFQIALSRPGGNMILAEPFTATVTIIDDDA